MIWISQWVCPSRHCAIALAWDEESATAPEIEERGEEIFRKRLIKRLCGICGQGLHVEHGCTFFKTMDEALPHLKAIEQANLVARSVIGGRF